MQHLDPATQCARKQRLLEQALSEAGLHVPLMLAPVHGPAWGYRDRARLAVRPRREGGVVIGFRDQGGRGVVDLRRCETLAPRAAVLLPRLRTLFSALSRPADIVQIEVVVGERALALVFRNLRALSDDDEAQLRAFSGSNELQVWLQPGAADSAYCLQAGEALPLDYSLPEFGLRLAFGPNDFTQVNLPANRVLVRRAVQLLAPRSGERIGDLFCGLGNFSLPLARRGASVVGVEGSEQLVTRAAANAAANGLSSLTEFHAADLYQATDDSLAALGALDKLLIDPPRKGARAVVESLARLRPKRIAYVSCNPSSLARDAALLVHHGGYRLRCASVVDMFPHTAHVESIALFERA